MSNRGRGRGNGSAYRSYDDYDDSYASPGPRSGRSGGGGRGYRGIGGDSSYFLQYGNAGPHGGPHGGLHGGPHGGPYGGPPGRGPPRAPYTAPQYQLVYVEQQQQQQQQQLQQPPQPHPHYRAYPYQYRQQQQQHSSGRNSYEGNRIYSAGGGAISGRSRPQFTPPPVVAAAAASAAASVGGGAIMPVGDRTPRPATLPRAPLTTSAGSGTGSVTPRQSTAAAAAAAAIDPDAPNNTSFMTPVFPQPPRTRTDSCSAWALMVEASCQQLEAVVGPFLEGALMELFGESWERELFGLDLTLPPFSAAACAALVAKCKQLHEKLPITIHKRVEAVAQATESLKSSPGSLAPEDVTAAHTAMRGMLHVKRREDALAALQQQLEGAARQVDLKRQALEEADQKHVKEKSKRQRVEEEVKSLQGKVEKLKKAATPSGAARELQEEVDAMRQLLNCNVCHERQKNRIITKCCHVFCDVCIDRTLTARNRKCPGCGIVFAKGDIKTFFFT